MEEERSTDRGLQFYLVNAFVTDTSSSLKQGNPAAVVLLPPHAPGLPLSDDQQQAIGAQMNISETAFVSWDEHEGVKTGFNIRWFTPLVEVDLCGHATLAAGAVLLYSGVVHPNQPVDLRTKRKGTLRVTFDENPFVDKRHIAARMSFPALYPQRQLHPEERAKLLDALGVFSATRTLRTEFDLVAELPSVAAVATLCPDMAMLGKMDMRGVIVCARGPGGDQPAIVSRFFAPSAGIDEDPVTGSAHCVLAAMYLEPGESAVCRQLSARGGRVDVTLCRGSETGVETGRETRNRAHSGEGGTLRAVSDGGGVGGSDGTDRVEIGGIARVVAGGGLYV